MTTPSSEDKTVAMTDDAPFENQRLQKGQGLADNLRCLASNTEAAWRAFGPDWAQAVANSALDALAASGSKVDWAALKPSTGVNYAQGLWSRRNWEALVADQLAAAHTEQSAAMPEPIDMVLHCPKCGEQHIDGPAHWSHPVVARHWDNPPHRSHLCHYCGHIWRPADVPTNGVAAVQTNGKDDSPSGEAYHLSQGEQAALRRAMFRGVTLKDDSPSAWVDANVSGNPSLMQAMRNHAEAATPQTAAPAAQPEPAYTYKSTQETECAGCGKRKHTPLRIDAMGGYVCLTCIDQKLGSLLGEFGYPTHPDAAQPEPVELSDERIDRIAELVVKGMPDGIQGFCKSWGWRQFARAILADCAGYTAAPPPAAQSDEALDAQRYRGLIANFVRENADGWLMLSFETCRQGKDHPPHERAEWLGLDIDAAIAQKGTDHG